MNRRGGFRFCPWAASVARGWSFELGISLVLCVLGHVVEQRAGSAGVVLFCGGLGIVLWRSQRLREVVLSRLNEGSTRRFLQHGFRTANVAGPGGWYPVVEKVTKVPLGHRAEVRLPRGSDPRFVEDKSAVIAAALKVGELRMVPNQRDASRVELVVVVADPLRDRPIVEWPLIDHERTSISEPIPVGLSEDGELVEVRLFEHHLLIGGEPGAGKSVALQLFVAAAALDPGVELSLLDGKQVELAPWEWCASHFVGANLDQAVSVLELLVEELDERYSRLLSAGRRKLGPGDGLSPHLVAIDELAYFVQGGSRATRERFEQLLRDLVSRGRAAGMIVVAATQKPSHDVIPTAIRDLFSYRLALRCTTREASDTILGQGWASQGYSASAIAPEARGVGLLLYEGSVPVRLKLSYLSDDELRMLAARAAIGREAL